MRRSRSTRSRRAGRWGLAALATMLAWAFVPGCEEGRAPYDVLPERGGPTDYVPPGVRPGTTRSVGQLYNFDRARFRLQVPIPGTDPHFIRADSVLTLVGATVAQRLRPDLSDRRLAWVYANPRLFGFRPKALPDTGFVDGETLVRAHEFLPVQPGNWYEYNHNSREWIRADTLAGVAVPTPGSRALRTHAGMTMHRMRSFSSARSDLSLFRPTGFGADVYFSVEAGRGIFFHAWSLVAERVVHPDLRGGPRGEPAVQRNPRFLWLSIGSLGVPDQQAPIPDTPDQCLDGLQGFLELAPFQLCGSDIRIGETYTTWAYLSVEDADVRRRVSSEPPCGGARLSECGRCGRVFVTPYGDTIRMFPTRTFSLLCKFEARAERAINRLVLLRAGAGSDTVGVYPAAPPPGFNVVQFNVTMFMRSPDSHIDYPVQYMEIFYLRGVGEVVRRTGVNLDTRSLTRLRSAFVNGRPYDPTDFRYFD